MGYFLTNILSDLFSFLQYVKCAAHLDSAEVFSPFSVRERVARGFEEIPFDHESETEKEKGRVQGETDEIEEWIWG